MPDYQSAASQADPWDSIDQSVFEVPDMDHPDHRPGKSLEGHEFVMGEPMKALDVQKEKNPYEDHPEDEDEEDETPEDEVLEEEAYMTKEYYMPGYVDETPAKEYPPHIA